MRRVRRLTTAVLATLGLLAFMSAPAWAANGYESVTSKFGGPCGVGEVPCGPGKFKEPTVLAVNDVTGDVYVVDHGNNRVEYFNASGGYLGELKTPLGGFSSLESIAVDNSGSGTDPSKEDVYVTSGGAGSRVIDEFSETGKYEGQLTGRCETAGEAAPCAESTLVPFSGLLDVAVDPSGNLWVQEGAEIYEFSDVGGWLASYPACEGYGAFEAGFDAGGFAVDSSGNFYIDTGQVLGSRIDECSQTEGRIILNEHVSSLATVAIIAANNNLLVDERSKIELYKSPIARLGQPLFTFPSTGLSESAGIAVNGAKGEGTIYATQRGDDDVDVFESAAPEAPTVISESASSPSLLSVQFAATINTGNRETTYSFEYSNEVSVNGKGELGLEGGINTLAGETTIPAEFGGQAVISPAFEPSSYAETFYYRVVAENEQSKGKPSIGRVQTYTKVPVIADETFSHLSSTSATLEATVNPVSQTTEYRFEYASSKATLEKAEGTRSPGGSVGEAEGSSEPLPVNGEVASLTPGETYYYRVVAENEVSKNPANANKGKPVDGEIEEVRPYAPPAPVTGEAQNITGTAATLSGEVNPEGTEATYYFEYISNEGFQAALEKGAANPEDPEYQAELAKGIPSPYAEGETTTPIAVPTGDVPRATGEIPVSGLLSGTTYHYVLVATNKFELRSLGHEGTFTTLAGTPPVVTTGAVSNVSQNSATLSGTVATSGLQTEYGFEIGTAPGNYGPATGLGSIGGSQTEAVSLTLGELQPGTTYYYRVTATSVDGTTHGEPVSFTTPGFPTLLTPQTSPPLIATPNIAFPTEEPGSGTTTTPKALTNAQKLTAALKVCRKDKAKGKKTKCEKAARKKYPVAKTKKGRK